MPLIDNVYEIKKEIGHGGMAKVYLADVNLEKFDYTQLYGYTQVTGNHSHYEKLQKAKEMVKKLTDVHLDPMTIKNILKVQGIPIPMDRVALKICNTTYNENNREDERFRGEWEHLICLNHKNVIQVYGGGVYRKRSYYAMELIENMIKPKEIMSGFSLKDKLQVIIQAGQGLAYLHKNGIIHRDVKPSNFITTKSNGQYVTKITDLGMAKNIEEDLGMTTSQSFIGTPYYMSPEQIKSAKDVDARADIYSLGASLYEMVTGKKPYFDKTSVYEIIEATTKGEGPHPPEKLVPSISESIRDIIKCSMHRNVEQRYQKMEEFVKDLETYLDCEGANLDSSMTFDMAPKVGKKGEYLYPACLSRKLPPDPTSKLTDDSFIKLRKKAEAANIKLEQEDETQKLLQKMQQPNDMRLIFMVMGGITLVFAVFFWWSRDARDENHSSLVADTQMSQKPVAQEGVLAETVELTTVAQQSLQDDPSKQKTTLPEAAVQSSTPPSSPLQVNPVDAQINAEPEPLEQPKETKAQASFSPDVKVPNVEITKSISEKELSNHMLDLMRSFHNLENSPVPKIEDMIKQIARSKNNAALESSKETTPKEEVGKKVEPTPLKNPRIEKALTTYDLDVEKSRIKLEKIVDFELKKAMKAGDLEEANRLNEVKKTWKLK